MIVFTGMGRVGVWVAGWVGGWLRCLLHSV